MTSEIEQMRFEDWYFDNWPHGEATSVHHAHKKGCKMAWQAALANLPRISEEELIDLIVGQLNRAKPVRTMQRAIADALIARLPHILKEK